VLLPLVALTGCQHSKDYRPLGAVTLAERAEGLLLRAYPDANLIRFDRGYEGEATYAADRFPPWAEGRHDHCIAWTDGFRALRADRTRVAEGRVWGWVLLAEENLIYGSRILEVSCEDAETGKITRLLDGWGLQLEEVGTETIAQSAEAKLIESYPGAESVVVMSLCGEKAEIAEAEDRFPAWAQGSFDLCLCWRDAYSVRGRAGTIDASGEIWGWILVSTSGRTHILEISHRISEAGETICLVDRWEHPDVGE